MKNKAILQRLGFNEKESEVYLSLIKSGPTTVSNISRNTGIHRPLIYKLLPNLMEKDLIHVFPKGKLKYYVAEDPIELKKLLNELEFDLNGLIPQLSSQYFSQDKKPLVKFLQGKKGISFVFSDIVQTLAKGDVFYRYSSAKDTKKADKYLPKDYREIRDKKQIERFVITNEKTGQQKKARMERAVKTIPKEFGLFDYDITQIIFGDKVAFVDYNTETALLIENSIIAKFQKKIFKVLYTKI